LRCRIAIAQQKLNTGNCGRRKSATVGPRSALIFAMIRRLPENPLFEDAVLSPDCAFGT